MDDELIGGSLAFCVFSNIQLAPGSGESFTFEQLLLYDTTGCIVGVRTAGSCSFSNVAQHGQFHCPG